MRAKKNELPSARDLSVLTIRKARKVRPIGTRSFRVWARNEFGNRQRGHLSPKLAQIVHGPA